MSVIPSPQSPASCPLRLPPTERDFEIYDAIHIDGSSTRYQAKQHEISQTRVRQIIRRVVEWLGEVLPPQTKVAKEQETRLARQIAADRFQRQFEQINELWKATLETKFASIRIRLTTAQARLGVVGGLIDGLAADAIEGLPVPTWQPCADPAATQSEICNPESAIPPNPLFPPPGYTPNRRRDSWKDMPVKIRDPLGWNEVTPEIVAARAAWGDPLQPAFIKTLQNMGQLPRDVLDEVGHPSPDPAPPGSQSEISNLKSEIPPPPPPGDCSPSDHGSSEVNPANATPIVPTQANPTTCEQNTESPCDNIDAAIPVAHPLLTPPTQTPAIEVRISPDHPGATTVPPHPTKESLIDSPQESQSIHSTA